MPKNKRGKVVHLTKVKKKGKEQKALYIEKIQEACDKYENCFVFNYQNMITRPFREIQAEFSTSKFFLGKNKVIQIALGKDEETEYQQNLHLLGKHIGGECGLLFTNNKPEEVHKFFASFSAATYAKGGVVANEDVLLKAGKDAFSALHGSMEPMVRSLGVPTHLEDEKIVLEKDFQLAKSGEELSVEKAKVLRFLGKKLGEFKIKLLASWNKSGEYKSYEQFHHHTN